MGAGDDEESPFSYPSSYIVYKLNLQTPLQKNWRGPKTAFLETRVGTGGGLGLSDLLLIDTTLPFSIRILFAPSNTKVEEGETANGGSCHCEEWIGTRTSLCGSGRLVHLVRGWLPPPRLWIWGEVEEAKMTATSLLSFAKMANFMCKFTTTTRNLKNGFPQTERCPRTRDTSWRRGSVSIASSFSFPSR